MCSRKAVLFLAAVVVLYMMFMPQTAGAVDVIVETNPTDPSHFSSINSAITFANNIITTNVGTTISYQVVVEPGTYPEAVSLISNISVIGRETARTILTGGVTASGVTNVNFQHFTIINASPGISVSNNSSVNITNNVFQGALNNSAIVIQNPQSTQTRVINNTFYQNGTALSADGQSLTIENNIFSLNGTAISQGVLSTSTIVSNAFFQNNIDGPKGTAFIPNGITVTLLDPLFVDPSTANRDFHLKEGSPCIDNGATTINDAIDATRSDIGAYGGPNQDLIPFPVANVTASADPTDPTTISISWSPNASYQVAGYRIYYDKTPGTRKGTSNLGDNSPINTVDTQFTLGGLDATAVVPGVPAQNPPLVQNDGLVISWSAVPAATGYKIYYSTSSFDASSLPATVITVDGGNTTSQPLTGLTNGQNYFVAVSAVASAAYYFQVTAFDSRGETVSDAVIPGRADESAFSTEVPVTFGAPKESGISAVLEEFPEALVPFPNLPNTRRGCFIATAAFGHYSAYQVQALRKFRDRYLLTNKAGSAFVGWYYTYGPHAAAWLDANPTYKPVVRAVLLPAVGVSILLTETTPALRTGMLLASFFIFAAGAYFFRKKLAGHGGLR